MMRQMQCSRCCDAGPACLALPQDPLRAEEATLLLQDACRAPSSLASAVTAVVGVLAVLREAVKRRTPFSRVQAAMEGANFPSTTSAALAAAAERSASAIAASALSDAPRLPGLSNLRWRVDVQIASSSAARVLRPCVVLEWTLSDGAVHTMTASTEQFHLLRHGVAKTLKGIIDDESHFVMRLSADMERAAARKQGK